VTGPPAADVVIVPDFDGPRAEQFEALTLLFLAAWTRHAGRSRQWPLHVVCVGDPPRPVRAAAAVAGARLGVVDSLPHPRRYANKLRGLEVEAETGGVLLLDTDTLVLADLAPLVARLGDGIGVGVATVNHFPEDSWRLMYGAAGVPYPGPTGTCWCADPRLAAARGLSPDQAALCQHMPPYFNSGVVWTSVPGVLRARWIDHMRRIAPVFSGPTPARGWGGGPETDEHALATAVESLRLTGVPVVAIPPAYHTRPILLRAAVLSWAEVAIFHYHGALKQCVHSVPDLRGVRDRVSERDREALAPFYDTVELLADDVIPHWVA
jgi:hypothetical protein